MFTDNLGLKKGKAFFFHSLLFSTLSDLIIYFMGLAHQE